MLRVTLATGLLLVAFAMVGCETPPQSEPATPGAVQPAEPTDVVSSDPRVQYFHDQLIANGEDLQSDFGGHLTTLGLSPRDLQQDDPKHAYDEVVEKVRRVDDVALRREMTQAFFNVATLP